MNRNTKCLTNCKEVKTLRVKVVLELSNSSAGAVPQGGYRSFSGKVTKYYRKMSRLPVYQVILAVTGFPTFLFVLVKYLLAKQNSRYYSCRRDMARQLEEAGAKEQLYQSVLSSTQKKYAFLHKETSQEALSKEVNRAVEQRFSELVESELAKTPEGQALSKPDLPSSYESWMESPLFFLFSLVTAPVMYLIILIYSNPYSKYIADRLVMMVFVIFGVTFLVFTILYFSPSDPAINALGELATPEQIQRFKELHGLDQPYLVQLFKAFKNIATFDLGKTYIGNEDVLTALLRKFPATLSITLASLCVSLLLSIIPGIISAMKQYSAFDYIFMLVALLGLSIPNFWLGLVMIMEFSIHLGLVPATYNAGQLATIIMPAIVLGTELSATIARMTRSSMLEVKSQDYILTARAKGLSSRRVTFKHILGNAMIPIVTAIGLQFGGLLGGSSVTEKIFNVSGVGSYIVDKQFVPDTPAVLSGVVYIAIIISIVNLAVDILYAFLDPRIKSKMKNY